MREWIDIINDNLTIVRLPSNISQSDMKRIKLTFNMSDIYDEYNDNSYEAEASISDTKEGESSDEEIDTSDDSDSDEDGYSSSESEE